MSSKKRLRPLFEVPADIESAGESGWVYRSNGHAEKTHHYQPVQQESFSSITDSGAITLALGMAAVAQALMLGMTIAAIPWTYSLRTARAIAESEG